MRIWKSFVVLALLASSAAPAAAQIKPQSSGKSSFNAPQMRRHGSGLYRPNRPHRYHRHHRRHMYPFHHPM